MASPITEIKQSELSATLRCLEKAGATTDHADWMRGRGNAALLIQFIDETRAVLRRANDKEPEFRLVHGVFNPTADVLVAFKARCAAKGVDFTKFTWTSMSSAESIGSEQAPEFTDDEEVAVVLDATLDTLQSTFEFAWAWTVDGQDDKWRWEGMLSDEDKLALLDGLEFKPWTLTWRRIKLNANVGKKPCDIRDPKTSPGCTLLFMSAEHPARIKATDYQKRFGFWLPGLKCTAPGERRWRSVPCVRFDRDCHRVRLFSRWCGDSHDFLAVPVLWE